MSITRGYFIALGADAATALALIATIKNDYQLSDDDGIEPSTILSVQDARQLEDSPVENNTTLELDSAGVPWDERIHASSKTKNSDGTWRSRRGVDKKVVEKITAELKAAVAATGTPAADAPAPTMAAPTMAAPQLTPYQQLLKDIGPHVTSGVLNNDFLDQLARYYNVEGGWVNLAAAGDDVIAKVRAYIAEQLATRGLTL